MAKFEVKLLNGETKEVEFKDRLGARTKNAVFAHVTIKRGVGDGQETYSIGEMAQLMQGCLDEMCTTKDVDWDEVEAASVDPIWVEHLRPLFFPVPNEGGTDRVVSEEKGVGARNDEADRADDGPQFPPK